MPQENVEIVDWDMIPDCDLRTAEQWEDIIGVIYSVIHVENEDDDVSVCISQDSLHDIKAQMSGALRPVMEDALKQYDPSIADSLEPLRLYVAGGFNWSNLPEPYHSTQSNWELRRHPLEPPGESNARTLYAFIDTIPKRMTLALEEAILQGRNNVTNSSDDAILQGRNDVTSSSDNVCSICLHVLNCERVSCKAFHCPDTDPPQEPIVGHESVRVCTVTDALLAMEIMQELTNEPGVVTHCGHIMHASCLKGWMMRNNNTCPVCRAVIAPEDDFSDEDPSPRWVRYHSDEEDPAFMAGRPITAAWHAAHR